MLFANILQPLTDIEQWVLERLHSIGLGWGLAIVGLTVLVRLSTVPLVVRQFRSQRELRVHMPEMKRLQQRHKDDKQRLQKEMQAYYREHKINPLAAFFPLLIQIPVFISLYYLMRTDVKSGLFGSDGFLFIPNLTSKPTGAVLVALILAYLSSQLSGSIIATRSMQGGQRGLMLALPLLFVGIVARFPAGLAVYWITTSLWTLGQQIVFWRLGAGSSEPMLGMTGGFPDAAPAPAAAGAPGGSATPRATGGPSPNKKKKRKKGHGRRR